MTPQISSTDRGRSEAFGAGLQKARDLAGLDQDDVAQRLGLSRQTISRWENGQLLPQTRYIAALSVTPRARDAILDALDVPLPLAGIADDRQIRLFVERMAEVVDHPLWGRLAATIDGALSILEADRGSAERPALREAEPRGSQPAATTETPPHRRRPRKKRGGGVG